MKAKPSVGLDETTAFPIRQRFGGQGEVANRVLLEAGTASGREPSAIVELRSYFSQYFGREKATWVQKTKAILPSPAPFRRTFVEKMFAIHSKVELLKRDKQPLGSYARHYYDLFQLSESSEFGIMLLHPKTPRSRLITIRSVERISQELLFPRRHALRPQWSAFPAFGTPRGHRSGVRGSMPTALLRRVSLVGQGKSAILGATRTALTQSLIRVATAIVFSSQ